MSTITRRSILAGIAATSLAGLAGCGGSSEKKTASKAAGKAAVPAHVPFDKVKPTLASKIPGGLSGFDSYPNPPVKIGNLPLPKTEKLTSLLMGYEPVIPHDQNPWWQQLETDLGTQISITGGAFGQPYADKFQTTIASNDLPDIVQIYTLAPRLPQLLESKFANLSEFLAGDAIKEFPNLASLPQNVWQLCTWNGQIYGVAQPRPAVGRILSTRGDLLKAKGIEASPSLTSGDEFYALLKEVAEPSKNVFAVGTNVQSFFLPLILEMMGAPNGWTEKDGTFTHAYTSEQYEPALEFLAKCWKEKLLHPQSFTQSNNAFGWWKSGATVLYPQFFAGWPAQRGLFPDWNVGVVASPKWEGGGEATKHLDVPGFDAAIGIAKDRSPERIKEILRIFDAIAAPFGTEEYLRVHYGAEGKSYTMKDGNPVATEDAGKMAPGPLFYAGGQINNIIFVPGQPEAAKEIFDYTEKVLPNGVSNAQWGLYSQTYGSKGAAEDLQLMNVQADIIQGRSPVSTWSTKAAEWKKSLGDKIAEELAESKAANQG